MWRYIRPMVMNIEVLIIIYLCWGKAVTPVRAYCERRYFRVYKFFANLRKLAISCGLKFAYFFLLLVCGIIKVIFNLYIFSRIFDEREKHENMYSANNFYIHSSYGYCTLHVFETSIYSELSLVHLIIFQQYQIVIFCKGIKLNCYIKNIPLVICTFLLC